MQPEMFRTKQEVGQYTRKGLGLWRKVEHKVFWTVRKCMVRGSLDSQEVCSLKYFRPSKRLGQLCEGTFFWPPRRLKIAWSVLDRPEINSLTILDHPEIDRIKHFGPNKYPEVFWTVKRQTLITNRKCILRFMLYELKALYNYYFLKHETHKYSHTNQ